MVIDITGGGTLPNAITSAYNTIQQKRQENLKSALEGLNMMRTLYGDKLPPGVFENYANQIEQASKALGTPITFPRTQPTPATFSTAGPQPQNPMFRAGVGAGGVGVGGAAAAPKPQTPFPTAPTRPAPSMPQPAQPGGQILAPPVSATGRTIAETYGQGTVDQLVAMGFNRDVVTSTPLGQVGSIPGLSDALGSLIGATPWGAPTTSGGPGTATQPAPSPAPAPGPPQQPIVDPVTGRLTTSAAQPAQPALATSAGPAAAQPSTGQQPQQPAQPQFPTPPQLADLNPTQQELATLRTLYPRGVRPQDWPQIRKEILDSRRTELQTEESILTIQDRRHNIAENDKKDAVDHVTGMIQAGAKPADIAAYLKTLPPGMDTTDVVNKANNAALQQQGAAAKARAELPVATETVDGIKIPLTGAQILTLRRQDRQFDMQQARLDAMNARADAAAARAERSGARADERVARAAETAKDKLILDTWNSADVQNRPATDPVRKYWEAQVAGVYARSGMTYTPSGTLAKPPAAARATAPLTPAQRQAKYTAALGSLRGAYAAGGPGSQQFQNAVQGFVKTATELGWTPEQINREIKAIYPKWKPYGTKPSAAPSPSGVTPQRPGGTVPSAPPTPKAGQVLAAWNQSKQPVPRKYWMTLSSGEQNWLIQNGVQMGP